MKVYQVRGYPSNHYFVETLAELMDIMSWANKNDVRLLHECTGFSGYGFSITKNLEWFLLRWT